MLANEIPRMKHHRSDWYMIVGFNLGASASWNTQGLYKKIALHFYKKYFASIFREEESFTLNI